MENPARDVTFSAVWFGVCRNSQGTLDTDKLFTGQRLDDTGLYFYNARYYDATIGRFISADTIVQDYMNPQTLNRYSYCLNNPLKYIDPSGHDPNDVNGDGEVNVLDFIADRLKGGSGSGVIDAIFGGSAGVGKTPTPSPASTPAPTPAPSPTPDPYDIETFGVFDLTPPGQEPPHPFISLYTNLSELVNPTPTENPVTITNADGNYIRVNPEQHREFYGTDDVTVGGQGCCYAGYLGCQWFTNTTEERCLELYNNCMDYVGGYSKGEGHFDIVP